MINYEHRSVNTNQRNDARELTDRRLSAETSVISVTQYASRVCGVVCISIMDNANKSI